MVTIHPRGLYHVHAIALNVEIEAITIQQYLVLFALRVAVLKKLNRTFLISQISVISYESFHLGITEIARDERPSNQLHAERQRCYSKSQAITTTFPESVASPSNCAS